MSLHYLIDGYNLVKSCSAFAHKPLADGRSSMILWLTTARPYGSQQNRVTVVFDGRVDVFSDPYRGEIEVIFTQDTSADDRIRDIVEHHPRVKDIVVVSNDKGITHYVRALGAKIISIEQFSIGLKNKSNSGKNKSSEKSEMKEPNKHISHTQAEAINKEFRKLWVKDD